MSNDEILEELTSNIDQILTKLQRPVKLYHQTRDHLAAYDVSTNTDYRSNFTRFYRLRLPHTDCYDYYFNLLEQNKFKSDLSFTEVLAKLQTSTGRIEASFASKLVATVDPRQPVIDRIVLMCMGYRLPYFYEPSEIRMQKVAEIYERLSNRYKEMLRDARFESLKDRFTVAFPDNDFTDLKMLDLMIWQLRNK